MSDLVWITVSATGGAAIWPPSLGEEEWRVRFDSRGTFPEVDWSGATRSSPLFRLGTDQPLPALSGHQLFIHFLYFDPAFTAIGRIASVSPDRLRGDFFFSLGLASCVFVSEDADGFQRVVATVGETPRARETWTLVDGRLTSVFCETPEPKAFDPSAFSIHAYDGLSIAPRTAIDEFVSSMGLVLHQVAANLPSELETFEGVARLVNTLVDEIKFAEDPSRDIPSTLSEYSRERFEKDHTLAETVVHQCTDRIIQINAALAYLSTQALSGAVPILERRSLIRRYSLLGVGTAVLALTRIARSIERAFAAGNIEGILGGSAKIARPLDGLDQLEQHHPLKWREYSVERLVSSGSARDVYPKLPYFSGRLGYRESEYTISAALQSLTAGASPDWSLLTLTHEMLHGHVRNILSILLQGDVGESAESAWAKAYSDFRAHEKRQKSVDNLRDSIRIVILKYCCLTVTHGSLTRPAALDGKLPGEKLSLHYILPTEAGLRDLLEREMRNISEVLVHVLDLHYFYRSTLDTYLRLIWRSWSPLPQVRADVRQYILRSLLAIAAKSDGTPHSRFQLAVSELERVLVSLVDQLPKNGTLGEALAFMRSTPQVKELFYAFKNSLLLVDLAARVIVSDTIRGTLNMRDPYIAFDSSEDRFEDTFHYTLPDGFVDAVVHAPTAYLADRIAKAAQRAEQVGLETETVRMFLACSSSSLTEVDA